MISRQNRRQCVRKLGGWLAVVLFLSAFGLCQSEMAQPASPSITSVEGGLLAQDAPATTTTAGRADAQSTGRISGTIAVQNGALATGATVRLTRDSQPPVEVLSGDNGEFSFSNQPPGPFQLTVTANGFESQQFSGTLRPEAAFVVPEIVLEVARATTEISVSMTVEEVAQQQIEYQEQQRVLGFIPNFYASYVPDAAPLNPRQKFQLAWKSVSDPISIVGAAFLAGIYQAADEYGGYGQGAQGYAKRFGATYADVFIGTFIDSAVLTSVFKQDPRYFYRGTGSTKSRFLYAIGNAVMCKGDNKKYQPNYSAILGSFATSAIAYTYQPASDRSAGLLVQTALIRIAEGSVAGLFQEFVVKKLTPHLKKEPPPQP